MVFKIDGFDELERELNKLTDKAKKLDGDHDISFDILFNCSFMQTHTNYNDFYKFLSAGNFSFETQEDFDAIPEHELDVHVQNETNFSSWLEMQETALEAYVVNQLEL